MKDTLFFIHIFFSKKSTFVKLNFLTLEYQLLASIAYVLPATVTGYIAYYFFKSYLIQQNSDKKKQFLSDKKIQSLPIKLQAYERMLLFCERIHPAKIVIRIQSISDKPTDYVSLLIMTIEQEFEYNLVQQLYISSDAWKAVTSAKNLVINKFQQISMQVNSVHEFQESVFKEFSNISSPTEIAIEILKNEVRNFIS